jgi:uncharacterized protein
MGRLGRATIALYNSYDPVRFREAHRRALARAGALALAFRQNLVTLGFPFPKDLSTPAEVANWVASTTSIGEDGDYLRALAKEGRFQTFLSPRKGFPPQLGEVILTTSKPDAEKSVGVGQVVDLILQGRGVCLVFGLGPRGAPQEVRGMTHMHLDITNDRRSLETCTALGAVSAVIASEVGRRRLDGQ